jgi:effector-binding domain-containing protein
MTDIELVTLPPQPVAVVRGYMPEQRVPGFLGEAYGQVVRVLGEQGQSPVGPPFGQYQRDEIGFEVVAGFPITGPVRPTDRVQADTLPGGLTARVQYIGDYAGIGAAYAAVETWLAEHGYVPTGLPWESYEDGTEVAMPSTFLQVPCAIGAAALGDAAV